LSLALHDKQMAERRLALTSYEKNSQNGGGMRHVSKRGFGSQHTRERGGGHLYTPRGGGKSCDLLGSRRVISHNVGRKKKKRKTERIRRGLNSAGGKREIAGFLVDRKANSDEKGPQEKGGGKMRAFR